jgi:hypothetical protein
LLGPAALELDTNTKSTVSVSQAVKNVATSRQAAEMSSNWLDLLNFMRIFRQRAEISGPQEIRFGIEPRDGQ